MRKVLASYLAGQSPSISDWEGFVAFASAERLLPALTGNSFFEAVTELNRERNLRLLDDGLEIAQVFNSIGIEPVLLKGAAYLVSGVHADFGSRYLCDLDLLVPAERLDEAAAALLTRGYQPDTSDAMARFRHHYPQLQRPGQSAPVEIHHSIGSGVAGRILTGEEMLRDARVVEWRGARVRLPSAEHLATHLIVHSQIHHGYRERIWPPLRAMYDLVQLNEFYGRRLDWGAMRARFQAHGYETTLALHLLQVRDSLGMPLPFAIKLGWMGQLRWWRRRALNRWPGLRWLDPVYLVMASLSRRMRLLKSAAGSPGGLRQAAGMLLRPGFYRRMAGEVSLR
jgi:Uncharacterised nucleotidyltransferase